MHQFRYCASLGMFLQEYLIFAKATFNSTAQVFLPILAVKLSTTTKV